MMKKDGDKFSVSDVQIGKITPYAAAEPAKKEYSDTDVQQFIQDYIKKQTKFSETMNLFDEEKNKMRNLKFLEAKETVKRLGSISIVRGNFEDVDSHEILGIDIVVQNKDGKLNLQNLFIRERKKGQTP